MALTGMTGFGRAQGNGAWGRCIWEVRSVNGKGLDVRLNMPSGLEAIDQEARRRVKSRFQRGNLQISVSLELNSRDSGPLIDTALLNQLSRRGRIMALTQGGTFPTLEGLLGVKGVVQAAGRSDVGLERDDLNEVLSVLDKALNELANSRGNEGVALHGMLKTLLYEMDQHVERALEFADAQPALMKQKFEKRIRTLLAESATPLTEERIALEAASHAAKVDVREELDRITAHLETGRKLMQQEGAVGRKLDFLSQELHRETNTLCSKSASLELTNTGLELKAAIEQFREQVQNVE